MYYGLHPACPESRDVKVTQWGGFLHWWTAPSNKVRRCVEISSTPPSPMQKLVVFRIHALSVLCARTPADDAILFQHDHCQNVSGWEGDWSRRGHCGDLRHRHLRPVSELLQPPLLNKVSLEPGKHEIALSLRYKSSRCMGRATAQGYDVP